MKTRDEMHVFSGFSKKIVTKKACFVTKFFTLFGTVKKYARKILTYKSRYDRILPTEDNMISDFKVSGQIPIRTAVKTLFQRRKKRRKRYEWE